MSFVSRQPLETKCSQLSSRLPTTWQFQWDNYSSDTLFHVHLADSLTPLERLFNWVVRVSRIPDRETKNQVSRANVVVKKCWRAYATPAIRKWFENLCLQSLALTKMSFNDFLLRYDSMGGSWNISFRCGWFWIRCHFPISIFLRLGKAGWYCVTQRAIFSFLCCCLCFQGTFIYLWKKKVFL